MGRCANENFFQTNRKWNILRIDRMLTMGNVSQADDKTCTIHLQVVNGRPKTAAAKNNSNNSNNSKWVKQTLRRKNKSASSVLDAPNDFNLFSYLKIYFMCAFSSGGCERALKKYIPIHNNIYDKHEMKIRIISFFSVSFGCFLFLPFVSLER